MRMLSIIIVLLAACSAPESQEPEATSAAVPDTPVTEKRVEEDPGVTRGRFVVSRDGEAILIEEFTRTADRIESELSSPGSAERATATYALSHDQTIPRVEVSITGGAADGQKLTVDVAHGQATVSARGGGNGPEQASLDVAEGTIPIPVNDSIVAIEQLIRRARVLGGSPVQVPILPRSMKPHRVTVEIGEGTAIVRGIDVIIDAVLDSEGNVTAATESRQGLTITRSAL